MAEYFDYIVVGGGVSGCVLGRRLSDAGYKVVILEMGCDPLQSESHRDLCLDPYRAPELWGNSGWMSNMKSNSDKAASLDFAFLTEPEPELSGRQVSLNCGCCLGGGSAINNQLYGVEWASPFQNPWDEWSEYFGLGEWSPRHMTNSVQRARDSVSPLPPDDHIRMAAFDAAIAPIAEPALAVGALSRVSWCVTASGQRNTAASAYLTSSSDKLQVQTQVQVTRLVFGRDKCCAAVEVMKNNDRVTFQAALEVIVCCGPIMTPVLLMQSGIGPRDVLEEAGVDCIVNSPHVGQNLITQPSLPLVCSAEPFPLTVSGPVAAVKTPIGRGIEAAVFNWTSKGVLYALCLCKPRARGHVRLSGKRSEQPKIQLNLLGDSDDMRAMQWGLERFRAALEAKEADLLREAMGGSMPVWPSDTEDTASWLKDRIATTRHPLGTCRMGRKIDEAVCDTRGRVFGVNQLRIGCNSLVPSPPPDTHVMRIAFALAERIAELVLEDAAKSFSSQSRL